MCVHEYGSGTKFLSINMIVSVLIFLTFYRIGMKQKKVPKNANESKQKSSINPYDECLCVQIIKWLNVFALFSTDSAKNSRK